MTKIVLTGKQRFQLTELIRQEYSTSEMTDTEFALHASQKLGFTVNDNHIAGVRKEWEIPNATRTTSNKSLEARIIELEAKVRTIQEDLSSTIVRLDRHVESLTAHSTRIVGGTR